MESVLINHKNKNILVGAGASGKDHAKNQCKKDGLFICDISYTTRPRRDSEIDGIDYHFVTKEKFEKMISNGEFLQFNMFGNGHYYGTTLESWEKSNIFIMTPNVLERIKMEFGEQIFAKNVIIYFFNIAEEIRKSRLEQRSGDGDSIERRLNSDREDFYGFSNFNYEITDPEFEITAI